MHHVTCYKVAAVLNILTRDLMRDRPCQYYIVVLMKMFTAETQYLKQQPPKSTLHGAWAIVQVPRPGPYRASMHDLLYLSH